MIESPGLGTLLRRLLAATDGELQALYDAEGGGFRPRFYPFVRHLADHGPAGVGTLAASAWVSQPAATQTIAELAEAGLVTIGAGDDRRARRIALTEAGEATAARLKPLWAAVERAAAVLDAELPQPLAATIAAALARLDDVPFRERVRLCRGSF